LSTERDNALFLALVEGEIDESSAEVREMFARDSEREREWRETKQLLAAIDEASLARDEVLLQVSRLKDAPGAEGAERALRAAMASDSSITEVRLKAVRRPTSADETRGAAMHASAARRWAWMAVAAAVLVCAFFILQRPRVPDDSRTVLLGSDQIQTKTTIDPVTGILCFEWQANVLAGSSFTVIVEGTDGEARSWHSVTEATNITANKWCPQKDAVASWPRRIRWKVVAIDAGLVESQSPWSELSLPL